MRNNLYIYVLYTVLAACVSSQAQTVAWWRFEDAAAGTDVVHSGAEGVFAPDIIDMSGSGNHLSAWSTGGGAGYGYRSDVAFAVVPQTYSVNLLSVKNTGGVPGMFTQTGSALGTMTPAAFTIEVSCKLENGGYRTIVGRDSQGSATTNANLAALYLQGVPNNGLAVKFCDVSGYWHVAQSANNIFTSFDYGANPEGDGVPWYSIAAVSDGSTLSLYLLEHGTDAEYQLIAQADLTASGSPDTALTAGTGDGNDWDAGNWTVGRGLYGGNHADRAYGFIDEVRISDTALDPSQFLARENFEDTAAYWRFEEGPSDAIVHHNGLAGGQFYPGVADVTGNGNHLSAWSQTLGAHIYRDEVAETPVPLTHAENKYSVQNADNAPGLFTSSADALPLFDIETWQPSEFSIEVSFRPEGGSGHRTMVGRDGDHVATINGQLAALYFQIQPDDSIAIKFADVSGYWHEAVSAPAMMQYEAGRWYHAAAVCDGSTLKLYLNDVNAKLGFQLVSQTDMTVSNSPDRRLVADTSGGSDWHGGGWTVGRGLYNGGHTDRFRGHIDEVRISRVALEPSEFLFYRMFYAGVTVMPGDLVVREQGATSGNLQFTLDSVPAADVLLTLRERDGRGQISLSSSSLLFTAADWNVPQTVQVTAIDDAVLENAEHRVPIAVSIASADPDYNGMDVDPVIVRVADNECGAWGYDAADLTLDCVIDFDDLVLLAQGWMACSDPQDANCVEFN